MRTLCEIIQDEVEPALCLAQRGLAKAQEGDADACARAHDVLKAARRFLDIHREPTLTMYDASALLQGHARELEAERRTLELDPVSNVPGDPEQVMGCLLALADTARFEADAQLDIALYEEDEVPRIEMSFDGPGRFDNPLRLGGCVEISMDMLCERWTAATRGGRIDRTSVGLSLRLAGIREVQESMGGLDSILDPVREAEQRLRLALADEGDQDSVKEASRAVADALRVTDEPGRVEPADLTAAVNEVTEECRETLRERGITLEVYCDAGMPPIAMLRRRVQSVFRNAATYARETLDRGGVLSTLIDYDVAERAVGIVATIGGTQCEWRPSCRLDSMERAIVDVHGGSFEGAQEGSGITLTATLPDAVGKTLDAWVPGFEVFTERSKQMLRLLKSGGAAPPAEILLPGILEEELESWLLPRLSQAQAMNLAHDLPQTNAGLAGTSADRCGKALTQVMRGKPRKEICKPPYAAEILWAFRGDERHRKAVGAELLGQKDVEALCTELLRPEADYVECLKTIARALTP
ncbi:MAG: hypothetical protein GY851_33660 [bacterium]|nr:hypothetical protein [bacterium]